MNEVLRAMRRGGARVALVIDDPDSPQETTVRTATVRGVITERAIAQMASALARYEV
jgi:hypothetical protein